MNVVDITYFIAVLFDVVLLSWYLHIFFKRKIMHKLWVIMIYIVAILIYFKSSVYFSEPYEKIIVYFFVCFILGFCYKGSIFCKLFLTTIYASIGVIIESSVSYLLIVTIGKLIPAIDSINYILGVTVSSVFFFFIICCIRYVWHKIDQTNNMLNEMISSYWNLLFLVLVFITVIISYGIDLLTIKYGLQDGIVFYCLLECLLVVFDIVVFFIFREMEQLQYEKMQTTLISQQNKAQELFYKESIKKNQQLRKIVHDEKNFLLGLIGYSTFPANISKQRLNK